MAKKKSVGKEDKKIIIEKEGFDWFKIVSFVLIVVGIVILLLSGFGITGNVVSIGEISSISVNWIFGVLGLAFVVGGVLIGMSGRGGSGGLEKLFFIDNKKIVRFNDFKGALLTEGIYATTASADEVLNSLDKEIEELDKTTSGNGENHSKEFKDLMQEILSPYIQCARVQRDSFEGPSLKVGTEEWYADKFLKNWDPHYEPYLNPLLRETTYANRLNRTLGVYDTRVVVPILTSNIPGLIMSGKMGSHDVSFIYKGSKISDLTAGTFTPYETDGNAINHLINRVARSDVVSGRIEESEMSTRINVLKKAIYGE